MTAYEVMEQELFQQIGDHKAIVLCTALDHHSSARMMSMLIKDGKFYFQTDCTSRKYADLQKNPQVALCVDNIQIEGVCQEIGTPKQHSWFIQMLQTCFPSFYEAYSFLQHERLFEVSPYWIQRWTYREGLPLIQTYHPKEKTYEEQQYIGI